MLISKSSKEHRWTTPEPRCKEALICCIQVLQQRNILLLKLFFFENHAKLLTSVKKMLVEIIIFSPSTTSPLNYRWVLLQGHVAKWCQSACGILCKCKALISVFAGTLHTVPSPWWWGIAQTVGLPVIIYTTVVQVSHRNCSANLPQTEQFLWWWGRCNLGSLTL